MNARPATPPRETPTLVGVVLRRELVRVARRPRTWVMRATYTGVLLAFLLYLLADMVDGALLDPSWLGLIGRQLFELYGVVQFCAVCLLAPVLVASGVQEEQDARTLDLLALTGLPAGRILLDQISSRLWVLWATVAAGLPAVAVLSSFGGFSPAEVVNTFYGAVAMAVLLGAFAGFAALVTRSGPVLPLALCLPYALVGVTGTWLIFLMSRGGSTVFASPLHAAFADDWTAPLGALVWLPALVSGWGLTVPVFRIVTSGDEHDEGFGMLSPDVWAIERFRKHTWLWIIATVIASFLAAMASDLNRPRGLAFGFAVVAAVCFATAWHRVALQLTLWLGERLDARRRNPWRLFRRSAREVRRPVVAWREVFTGAAGATRLVPFVVGALWLGLLALAVSDDGAPDESTAAALAMVSGTGAWLVAALIGIATLQDERRRDTLPLLFLTRLDPRSVAAQKVLAPLWYATPLLLMGMVVWGLSRPEDWLSDHGNGYGHELGPNLLQGVPGAAVVAWTAWQVLMAANVSLAGASAAGIARQPGVAWAAGLFAAGSWVFWPLILAVLVDVFDLSPLGHPGDWMLLWYPVFDDHARSCDLGGLPMALAGAIAVQLCALPLGISVLAGRLRAIAELDP